MTWIYLILWRLRLAVMILKLTPRELYSIMPIGEGYTNGIYWRG